MKIELDLFHGTDLEIAEKIVSGEFCCKKNLKHWLGNGIYFYLDESLARWWTTNPTPNYGMKICKPAIVNCKLEVDDSNVLDLRKLTDYKKTVEMFKNFYGTYITYKGDVIPTMEEIRSAFFDFCTSFYKYYVIIGNFYLPNQPYLVSVKPDYFKETCLEYIETQVCISQKMQYDLIKSKKYYQIESGEF